MLAKSPFPTNGRYLLQLSMQGGLDHREAGVLHKEHTRVASHSPAGSAGARQVKFLAQGNKKERTAGH